MSVFLLLTDRLAVSAKEEDKHVLLLITGSFVFLILILGAKEYILLGTKVLIPMLFENLSRRRMGLFSFSVPVPRMSP